MDDIIEINGRMVCKSVYERRLAQGVIDVDGNVIDKDLAKKVRVEEFGEKGIDVADWFLRKQDNYTVLVKSSFKKIKETEKAVYLKASSKYGSFNIWVPKTCLL